MPDCILRVSGKDFSAAEFVSRTQLGPYRVYQAGDEIIPGVSRRRFVSNGFKVLVSEADGKLPLQIKDAIAFLRRHSADLQQLAAYPDVTRYLDFGIDGYNFDEVPIQSSYLPAELLLLCGTLGIDVELSRYKATTTDEE